MRPGRGVFFLSGRSAAWVALGLLGSLSAIAAPVELSLRVRGEFDPKPLTTEALWKIDPSEKNPHRALWALSRKLELVGLEAVPLEKKGGGFGVVARGLEAEARGFARAAGPWYSPLTEFSCRAQAGKSAYANEAGSRLAAEQASRLWRELIGSRRVELGVLLGRISAASTLSALASARILTRIWQDRIEAIYRERILPEVRKLEWEGYLGAARAARLCGAASGSAPPKQEYWDAKMEKPSSTPSIPFRSGGTLPSARLMARAPARQWDRMFSVRMSVFVGDQELNGQFLIDSSVGTSILSPSWLAGQGVLPALIEIPGLPEEKVFWSGGGGIGNRAAVTHARVAGIQLPVNEFLLIETDLFGPPDHLASCCDGIIGTDILRHFVVEFDSGRGSHVKFWNPEGFSAGTEAYTWFESSLGASGELQSESCRLLPAQSGKAAPALLGVRWDSGAEEALSVHQPLQAELRENGVTEWEVVCGSAGTRFALGIPAVASDGEMARGPLAERFPSATIGIPLIARGTAPFFMDMGHGRLWFENGAFRQKISTNESGLELKYSLRSGERVLNVQSIAARSPSRTLLLQGLRAGMEIQEINGKPVEDLDLWEVEQLLAGRDGDRVILKWKSAGRTSKLAELKLR